MIQFRDLPFFATKLNDLRDQRTSGSSSVIFAKTTRAVRTPKLPQNLTQEVAPEFERDPSERKLLKNTNTNKTKLTELSSYGLPKSQRYSGLSKLSDHRTTGGARYQSERKQTLTNIVEALFHHHFL